MKRTIILSESELHRVIEECVNEALEEGMFKNAMMGLAVGAASMFPSQGHAQQSQQSYNYRTPNSVRYHDASNKNDSLMADKVYNAQDFITNHPLSEKDLTKIFPQAYKDRNANPNVWKANQTKYCGKIHGKNSIVGKVAAANGQNPWNAIVNTYTVKNYNSKTQKQKETQDVFSMHYSDFSI